MTNKKTQEEFDIIEKKIVDYIGKNGGIDSYDYHTLFGKKAKLTDFYPIMRKLESNGLVQKGHKDNDGTDIQFYRWLKTTKWDKPQQKEKNICFVSTPIPQKSFFEFSNLLELPTAPRDSARIYITSPKSGTRHRISSFPIGAWLSMLEIKEMFKVGEYIEGGVYQRGGNYYKAKKALAERIGAIKVEFRCVGRIPPLIQEIRCMTITNKAKEVKANLYKLLNEHGIHVSPNICKLVCEESNEPL